MLLFKQDPEAFYRILAATGDLGAKAELEKIEAAKRKASNPLAATPPAATPANKSPTAPPANKSPIANKPPVEPVHFIDDEAAIEQAMNASLLDYQPPKVEPLPLFLDEEPFEHHDDDGLAIALELSLGENEALRRAQILSLQFELPDSEKTTGIETYLQDMEALDLGVNYGKNNKHTNMCGYNCVFSYLAVMKEGFLSICPDPITLKYRTFVNDSKEVATEDVDIYSHMMNDSTLLLISKMFDVGFTVYSSSDRRMINHTDSASKHWIHLVLWDKHYYLPIEFLQKEGANQKIVDFAITQMKINVNMVTVNMTRRSV